MYRSLIEKFYIKKEDTHISFTSKRSYLSQLKNSGSLHIGHRSLNSKQLSTDHNSKSLHASGSTTPKYNSYINHPLGNQKMVSRGTSKDKLGLKSKRNTSRESKKTHRISSKSKIPYQYASPKHSMVESQKGSLHVVRNSLKNPRHSNKKSEYGSFLSKSPN